MIEDDIHENTRDVQFRSVVGVLHDDNGGQHLPLPLDTPQMYASTFYRFDPKLGDGP